MKWELYPHHPLTSLFPCPLQGILFDFNFQVHSLTMDQSTTKDMVAPRACKSKKQHNRKRKRRDRNRVPIEGKQSKKAEGNTTE